jgi:PAS domain S-box-containing protein
VTEPTAPVTARGHEALPEGHTEAVEIEWAQLRSAFDQSPSFMATLSGREFVFQQANAAYYELVGQRDLIGKPVFDALPDARWQGFEELLTRVLETGEPFIGREMSIMLSRVPGAAPEERFVDVVYAALFDAEGKPSGVLAHGTDVTEHVRSRREIERLLAEREQSRSIAEAASSDLQEQALELELLNEQLHNNAIELEMQAAELQATAAQLEEQSEAAESSQRDAELARIFSQAPVAVAVMAGPTHVFTLANAAYVAIAGERDLLGRTVREVFPEIATSDVHELLDRVYSAGEPIIVREMRLPIRPHPDAVPEEHVLDFTYQPLRDPTGGITGIAVVVADVTDQVAAREQLAASERQLRSLADAIPTLAWTAQADGYIDWYNARWYEYTGTTPQEMQGWGWQLVHDPVVLPDVMARWRAGIATGEPVEMTFPLKGANGQFRSFLTRIVPVKDADGRVQRWFGSNTDVEAERASLAVAETARRDAEASETRYRTLTEVLPVQVWTAALDGGLDYVGEQTCTYFGASANDLLGTGWTRFVHAEDIERAAVRWARALSTGVPYEAEFRLLRSDSEYRWHIARALPTRNPWGEITGWVGTNTDVEGERRARAEAEEAGQAAEKANRAKSDFLAVMSHELRTPLNAIGGYTELIALGIRGPVTEAQLEDLARIQRSQQHLLGLINDLLNMARLDSGQLSYDITDVPVNTALSRVEELILPQLNAKGLKYENVPCDAGVFVRADAEKLRQVLVNILSNATKYTETGCVSVWCDTNEESVRIHVRDTGPGIAPDQLSRIFEPFVQISAPNRPREGVGLGLAISRDLARGMAGDLTAESALAEGTMFTLTLPRA